MKPDEFLKRGADILGPRLRPLGYEFVESEAVQKGSGGPFASATFRCSGREITLWARFDRLGEVHYRLGEYEFNHQDYMRAIGHDKDAHWPGFVENDPLGDFRDLLKDWDLSDEVLAGEAENLIEKVQALPPRETGFRALKT